MICGMVLGITSEIIDSVDQRSASTQQTQVMYHICTIIITINLYLGSS